MIPEEASGPRPATDDDSNQLRKIYEKLLQKKKASEARAEERDDAQSEVSNRAQPKKERKRERSRSRSRENGMSKLPVFKPEFKLRLYEMLDLNLLESIKSEAALRLPVYKQHGRILHTILNNQVTLITGETGCGKSTQIPRILWQYLKAAKHPGKVLCVQPRRLAAMNLTKILGDQIREYGRVSYQIGMQNTMNPETKILYMTNGIFLQRLIHSCRELLQEYPFVVLDEVHERDIDTDFILLALMHILRNYPEIRVVLMSATLDNNLFKQYFAGDHIDRFLNKQNFYVQKLAKIKPKKDRERRFSSSEDEEDLKVTRDLAEEFMKCRDPCPEICITDKGCYNKKIYYLDTLAEFAQAPISVRWGQIDLIEKSAIANKELYEVAAALIREILAINRENHNILLFLPGYAEIQQTIQSIRTMCSEEERNRCEIIELHSTTLSSQIKDKLHETHMRRCKVIVATNIAESSITIFGVKYIIDFCLTKEIHYDSKSRLENLKLIWASHASCNQRAGRTGRVCDGYVFRLVSKEFYQTKFPKYSTPEIQRSSLDRIILRIKLLHEQEKEGLKEGDICMDIFRDPGKVLGKAIQPPALKNIDSAVSALLQNGGLSISDGDLHLTELGRFYVDIPIDIVYAKMLILSVLFGVYNEVLKLVAILSQHRNPFRKDTQNNRPLDYWEAMATSELCDFYSLARLYDMQPENNGRRVLDNINSKEVQMLANQLDRRVKRLRSKDGQLTFFECAERFRSAADFELRFKMLVCSNFIQNLIRGNVRQVDEKRQTIKRKVRELGLDVGRTVLLHSWLINCNVPHERRKALCETWAANIKRTFRLAKEPRLIINNSFCCAEFADTADICKLLFTKFCNEGGSRKSFTEPVLVETKVKRSGADANLNFPTVAHQQSSYVTVDNVLASLGEITVLHEASTSDFYMRTPINIDPYTVNRLIVCGSSNDTAYLVTNSKTDKVSSINCSYTCMLPRMKGACPLTLLVFSHYASVTTDRKGLRYESVKVKKRFEVKLDFNLMKDDMENINVLRDLLKKFYSLDLRLWNSEEMRSFWPRLKKLLTKPRLPMIEEDRWQRSFLQQRKLPLPESYMESQQPEVEVKAQFMGVVYFPTLRNHYFSAEHLSSEDYLSHIALYNTWKRQVLDDLSLLTNFVQNDQAIVCCTSCATPICRANDVKHRDENSHRQFIPLPDAIRELNFNEMGNSFCTGLMYSGIDFEYKVCGCPNGHPLAIKQLPQNTYKFVSFSALSFSFPIGEIVQANYENMDFNKVSIRLLAAIKERDRLKKTTMCRVCDETTQYVEHMKKHLKDIGHIQSVEEFKFTLQTLGAKREQSKI